MFARVITEQPKLSRAARRIRAGCVGAFAIAAAAPLLSAWHAFSQESRSADCLPRASRVSASCDPKPVIIRSEKEVEFSLAAPPVKDAVCVATIEIAYTQRDTAVSVEGTIANNVCAASSGDYKLVVSVRSEGAGVQQLEFFESWQREDDQPVKLSGTYPIGENVDLLRVRPAQMRCTCANERE